MDIVAVNNNQFTHYPKRIPRGTVNAELVQLRLDKEWEGLTVFWHWRNMGTKAEIRDELADPAAPHKIPWEVLTDLGDLEMGLVGMDGETTVKPTIWLTYGYVVDGVDPDIGDDPQPPTPNYLEQMVAQATQAKQAAQAAQEAAEDASESAASAGPYAEEAKKSAEAAKASQEAAATSARQANEAAQTAQNAAGGIGDAVKRAEDAATAAGTAQQAAETAQGAAARSAETAQGAATTANQAAQESNSAATKAGQYLTSVESAAQAAASARDQATTAATTAQGHATAASTAKTAAEQAAGNASTAQTGAAQSAQEAAGFATAAQQAKKDAEASAAILPKPAPEDAGKGLVVNPEGDGYVFGEYGGSAVNTPLVLIEEINVSEVISKITRTQFPDGTPYNLSSAFVEIKAKSEDSTGVISIIFHNSDTYGVIVADFAYITLKATTQVSIGHCRSLGSGCFEYDRTTDTFSTEIRATAMSGAKVNVSGADSIKQIVLSKFTADIPVGSTIRIWGCQNEN